MVVQFQNRAVPDELHQKMLEFSRAGDDIVWVAFFPGGSNRWSIIAKSGAYFNRNIPNDCHEKMGAIGKAGSKITRVFFTPSGGWSILEENGAFTNHDIPNDCHLAMQELSKNGGKIRSVAFPPQGGNSWFAVNDKGEHLSVNIPSECKLKVDEMSKNGAKVINVAFPPQGGDSWSVINDQGAYFNRNVSGEAHMYMGYFSEVYGPLQFIAFDADGEGWSVASLVTKSEKVSDGSPTVSILEMYNNIQATLANRVVGYACTVGSATIGAYSSGQSRTSADGQAQTFLPSTKIPVASTSKVVTALAAIRFLAAKGVPLESEIGQYFPKDWARDGYLSTIKFNEVLSQRSGIWDYGNNDGKYDTLKTFFTQRVDSNTDPKIINPAKKGVWNYSNWNFAIFRVLLPIVGGFKDFSAGFESRLAAEYIKIVQQNVFEPVGIRDVDCKPPTTGPQASTYAYSYGFPGTAKGTDWGDNSLSAGAAGWWLSIDDIAKVLDSLNKNDGRILTSSQLTEMVQGTNTGTYALGWDNNIKHGGYIQKNGGWSSSDGTHAGTTIALFPGGLFGALFVNSDILGPGLQNYWKWCNKCQALAFDFGSNKGSCPAGGAHDHNGSSTYYIPLGINPPTDAQKGWRWCKKCQALAFAGGKAIGKCSGGGQHDHSSSGAYSVVIRSGGGPEPTHRQAGWRWCNKCQVLSANLGACAGGGQHDHGGSGDYMLELAVGADTVLLDAYKDALRAI